MQFRYFILFFLIMHPSMAKAAQDEEIYNEVDCRGDITESMCRCPTFEAKVGYFLFADSKMNKVFDKGGLDLQLTGTYPLWNGLDLYASLEYFGKHGKSLGGHQRTSLWGIPFSMGLKMKIASYSLLRSYFTIGPRYLFLHMHNHSQYVKKNLERNGIGGFANVGLEYDLSNCLLLDVFAEASYIRMRFHSSNRNNYNETRQVGGYTFGGGLTYAF